jgi:hypothetical protein
LESSGGVSEGQICANLNQQQSPNRRHGRDRSGC